MPLGSGIGLASKDKGSWVIVIPLTLPGEKAQVRIVKNDQMHSIGEVLKMLNHNPDLQDNSRIKCRYFGTCAGCQYQVYFSISVIFWLLLIYLQMLSGETQLDLKRDVIINAYNIYSSTLS